MSLEVFYFDGQSSRRHTARLEAEAGFLHLDGPAGKRWIPHEEIQVSETQGHAPRTLRFADGTYCEVAQSAALSALLDTLGHNESVAVRMQNRWRWSLSALMGVTLILAAGYFWGLPWGAEIAAPWVPISAMQEVSETTLNQLDNHLLEPSQLSPERQQKLTQGFQQLAAADPDLAPYAKSLRLYFRSAPKVGPNAFALPGGQIVLLDELVELPINDEETLAVLAHELGHLNKRHGIRQLIQSSVVAAVAAAYMGDVSYLITTLTAVVLESGYSRDMEREADHYAATALTRQGQSPALLANALEKMENFYTDKKKKKDTDGEKSHFDWLSSHPDTEERIQTLRGNSGQAL